MSQDDLDFAEKRDFIRMFIDAPVDFAIAGTDEWFIGMGQDLSGGGLSFSTKQQLTEGDKVDVKLHPITAVTPPLEAQVTVIRAEQLEDGAFSISTKIEKILGE